MIKKDYWIVKIHKPTVKKVINFLCVSISSILKALLELIKFVSIPMFLVWLILDLGKDIETLKIIVVLGISMCWIAYRYVKLEEKIK